MNGKHNTPKASARGGGGGGGGGGIKLLHFPLVLTKRLNKTETKYRYAPGTSYLELKPEVKVTVIGKQ